MSTKRNISSLLNPQEDSDPQPPTKIPRLNPPSPSPETQKLPYITPTPPPTPPFQQPLPLLTFSYTPTRTLEFTDSALRYFVDPPRGADLNYGVERWIRRPEERGRVDGLLKAWGRVRKGLGEVGVVAWRGIITKILTAPYEMRDTWELNVMCIDGTMYFEEHLSVEKVQEKNDMSPHHRLQTYYGYAFESWCTSDTPTPQPIPSSNPYTPAPAAPTPNGWGGDVDTNVQWCNVVKTKLGGTRMVLGGEVDCVQGRYMGRTDTFVELKTSLVIRSAHDEAKFEKKLLKFYFQSFLLGVPEIVVGFRTPAGILSTLQKFRTVEIPRLVRGKGKLGKDTWEPGVCLSWGERFLGFLKGVVGEGSASGSGSAAAAIPSGSSLASNSTEVEKKPYAVEKESQTGNNDKANENDEKQAKEKERGEATEPTVWRVTFTPREGVDVRVLDEAEVDDVRGGEDRVGFLPRWFWEEMRTPLEHIQKETHRESKIIPPGWQI